MNKPTIITTIPILKWIRNSFGSLLLLPLVIFIGCRAGLPDTSAAPIAAPQANLRVGVDPFFHQYPPQRVVLFCSNEVQFGRTKTRQVVETIAEEIRSAGLFEIYAPQTLDQLCDIDEILHGRFDEAELLRLAQTYSADSVMFVRINEASLFNPMSASLTMAIVDVDEALLTFSMDGRWATQDQTTRMFFDEYLQLRINDAMDAPAEVLHHSPDAFIRFVANQVALVLKPNCQVRTIAEGMTVDQTNGDYGYGNPAYGPNESQSMKQLPDTNHAAQSPSYNRQPANQPYPTQNTLTNQMRDNFTPPLRNQVSSNPSNPGPQNGLRSAGNSRAFPQGMPYSARATVANRYRR